MILMRNPINIIHRLLDLVLVERCNNLFARNSLFDTSQTFAHIGQHEIVVAKNNASSAIDKCTTATVHNGDSLFMFAVYAPTKQFIPRLVNQNKSLAACKLIALL